mgnify:CR=1 FL=1
MAISKVDTRNTIALVWLIRYARAQPYHPSNIKESLAAVLALLGLIRMAQYVDTFPGGLLLTPLSSKLQMR